MSELARERQLAQESRLAHETRTVHSRGNSIVAERTRAIPLARGSNGGHCDTHARACTTDRDCSQGGPPFGSGHTLAQTGGTE